MNSVHFNINALDKPLIIQSMCHPKPLRFSNEISCSSVGPIVGGLWGSKSIEKLPIKAFREVGSVSDSVCSIIRVGLGIYRILIMGGNWLKLAVIIVKFSGSCLKGAHI